MKKIGVIIARFQTSYLHDEHKNLLRYVSEHNDEIIVFLGIKETRLTINNPLPYDSRKQMIENSLNLLHKPYLIIPLRDQKSNDVWSRTLDAVITNMVDTPSNICLYGGRDSFLTVYKGLYRTEFYDSTSVHTSSTVIRKGIHSYIKDSAEWREGVIYASAHRYPVSFQTVDIAPLNDKGDVLLGRKSGRDQFRFVGGFVDTADETLEMAAKRETGEECGDIETDEYKYLGSFRIDDWRYKGEQDKIMTAFFTCKYIYGNIKASDDIEELKWFNIKQLSDSDIEYEHIPLLKRLRSV